MSDNDKKILSILTDARDTLNTAIFGLSMLDDPETRKAGVRNVVVFGRAVTNTIQKLRSVHLEFDKWYKPWQTKFKNDHITSYLYNLRSEILKEGKLNTSAVISMDHLSLDMRKPILGNPPPGATSWFIGDSNGGSGWRIQLSTGETQRFYVSLANVPGLNMTATVYLADAPEGVRDIPITKICEHYINEMKAITDDAWLCFGQQQLSNN